MHDLLLRGGTVVDPSQGIHGPHDVAIRDGKIAAIAPGIPTRDARQIIDVSDRIVTPGLIDLHVHVFDGIIANGVNPDLVGVYAGVTTLVDAGSAGCSTIGAFPRYIIPNSQTEIMPFMHICQTGLATSPDIIAESSIDLESTLRAAHQYKDVVHGIKARMVSPALEIFGMEMPRLAKRAARESEIPLMVHVGDNERRCDPNIVRELLPILEEGDILTHYFTGNPGGVLDANGRLVPEAKEAADRGVWFDTAHGRNNFSFDVARRIVDQGLLPHCISTDITAAGRIRIVHSMTEIMARFLGLGFTLDQVVTMSTANPAKAIGEEKRLGSLAVGWQADISVLETRDGDWMVYDTQGVGLPVDKALIPSLTLKRGQVYEPDWGPRPWGWEPDPAQ